jgi:hypothetical protein
LENDLEMPPYQALDMFHKVIWFQRIYIH